MYVRLEIITTRRQWTPAQENKSIDFDNLNDADMDFLDYVIYMENDNANSSSVTAVTGIREAGGVSR